LNINQTKLVIQENIELAPLTTFKVGGAARFFVTAETENEVIEAFNWADENSIPFFILGGGSNILVSDQGFEGIVLQINLSGIKKEKDIITAQAGEDWDEFVKYCVENDLAGIECLSGIPGLVGGTPIQNVGAYGQEVSETILKVRVFDRKSRQILELNNQECKFSYRTSIFNSTDKNRFIVIAVTFKLNENGTPKIVYKDLLENFQDKQPTLRETREMVCKIRAEKAMLVRQGGADSQSAGSFFKNPIVSNENYNEVCRIAEDLEISAVPCFKVDEKAVKIPAAWLIEKSGFHKGYRKGNAGLSTKHTLALTNRGDATAQEILALKEEIESRVYEIFKIELHPEPILVGK
jgi:UDP-N-acetylmuramate dehydrogenase